MLPMLSAPAHATHYATMQEVPVRGQMRDVAVPDECPQCVADVLAACLQVRRQTVQSRVGGRAALP